MYLPHAMTLTSALTIAGSDPSGGAGIQADLKTFHQHGLYGTSALTLVTVQNTQCVSRVMTLAPELVVEQIRAIVSDIPPGAAKTGALGSAPMVRAVAKELAKTDFPLVVDPVMLSKHGDRLIDDEAVDALVGELFPRAAIITPNAHEATVLSGRLVDSLEHAEDAARRIGRRGLKAVLIKGARFGGDGATDILWHDGKLSRISSPYVDTLHTHGTGCTLSAAITAWLARGVPLVESVERAKRWLSEALQHSPGVGGGIGPVNHLVPVVQD